MQRFTRYAEAKAYFGCLSNHHNKNIASQAAEYLETYEDIKRQAGEFFAAKFILDMFLDALRITEEQQKGVI